MDTPEFSRPLDVSDIPSAGIVRDIGANADERAALARRFGLLALDRLEAHLTIKMLDDGHCRVSGRLFADVTQPCVVSLEPVPAKLDAAIAATFAADLASEATEIHVDAGGGDDDPEPMEGGRIDLGETVAQHLALALDPYPRKAGVDLGKILRDRAAASMQEGASSPFAKLSELKKKLT
jgi:uncharacterized metal-binding protein YceD (DUF177 family)